MKKRHSWVRYVIEGVLILTALSGLIYFRHNIPDMGDVNDNLNIILAFIFICIILIPVIQMFFNRIDIALARRERDEDISRLKTQAQTDALTGLLNREAAIEKINQYLMEEGQRFTHTLIIIDLDNFKTINDSFGHFEGDKVLKTIAGKIKTVFRSVDIVGRLGGDEFIVFIKNTATINVIRRKANELQTALEYVATGGDVTVTVTGSIGITLYEGDGKTFETMFKEADEALYRAKMSGKSKFCYFKESNYETIDEFSGAEHGTALKESSAFVQLQALIDNIDGGIAMLEIGDEINALYMSSGFIKLLNLPSYSKNANNRILNFIAEADAGRVRDKLRQGAFSGKSVDDVFRRLTEDGETKWYHLRAVKISYENSDKPVLIAIVTDVTNLKTAELIYQTQKKQLETVLRISRVVTFEVDIAKRTLYVSQPTVVKYGIDVQTIENMPDFLIDCGAIHPGSIDECRRMYNEIYAGVPEGSAVIRTLKRDGEYTIERFTYFTVFGDDGRPIKAVGVDEGLETRAQASLRVDLIERQFREYPDNMLSVIKVTVDEDAFVLLKPEQLPDEFKEKIKTYSDLLDYMTLKIIDPEDRLLVKKRFNPEMMKVELPEGQLITQEYKVSGEDGVDRWHSMSAGIYLDQFDGGTYAFVRTRDITFRKSLELMLDEPIEYESGSRAYRFDSFEKLINAYLHAKGKNHNPAIMLFSIKNYSEMLGLYGQLMLDDMIVGFIGKIMTTIEADYIAGVVNKHTVAVFVPHMQSEDDLREQADKALRLLKNPAYFQFHEEVFLTFCCGISVSANDSEDFNTLVDHAASALRTLDAKSDEQVVIYRKSV